MKTRLVPGDILRRTVKQWRSSPRSYYSDKKPESCFSTRSVNTVNPVTRMQRIVIKRATAVLAVVFAFAIGWWVCSPRQGPGFPASKRMMCANNMKWLGLALRQYDIDHGTLPPAFIPGDDEKPSHSWRILLLPYLNQQDLYDKYRFDEPWNGPNNSKLAAKMPDVFRCPSCVGNTPPTHTNYVACIHKDSVLSGSVPNALSSIDDPTQETMLFSETKTRAVHWMSPFDVPSTEMYVDIADGIGIHDRGFNAIMADGAAMFLPHTIRQSDFESLVTRSGNEEPVELHSHPLPSRQ